MSFGFEEGDLRVGRKSVARLPKNFMMGATFPFFQKRTPDTSSILAS